MNRLCFEHIQTSGFNCGQFTQHYQCANMSNSDNQPPALKNRKLLNHAKATQARQNKKNQNHTRILKAQQAKHGKKCSDISIARDALQTKKHASNELKLARKQGRIKQNDLETRKRSYAIKNTLNKMNDLKNLINKLDDKLDELSCLTQIDDSVMYVAF